MLDAKRRRGGPTLDQTSRSPAALRARRRRVRQRLGLKVYTIDVDEWELIAAILDLGHLTEQESRDDAKVSAVIGRILSEWIAQYRR
jgi:hypothetical protein